MWNSRILFTEPGCLNLSRMSGGAYHYDNQAFPRKSQVPVHLVHTVELEVREPLFFSSNLVLISCKS